MKRWRACTSSTHRRRPPATARLSQASRAICLLDGAARDRAADARAREYREGAVRLDRDDGRRQTFRIVGEDEAEPAQGTLSYVSPVAQALMNKQEGDVIRAGTGEAEIVDIR